MATENFLESMRLCKSFGGLQAVRDVNFSMRQGQVRAIIGPNGAGKTTLVNLLSGRIKPTSGWIRFQTEDITKMPAWKRVRRGIAYTFQITSIYSTLSVYENIAIAAQVQTYRENATENKTENKAANKNTENKAGGHRRDQIESIVTSCLQKVGLQKYSAKLAGELAYGHQRLLEIAMGLALNPSLLILDEPTQGLSDGEIADFIHLIESIQQEMTVLLIEHNMAVVMALADSITVLDQGAVLANGTPDEIQANDEVQAAYLGG